ncbi:hypothetical protein [Micromonospora sp. NBC_01796]|uniref:hypothetical protein n=1 Tax=Micromonospora sp. NBC_01796 TaxID=2975987 RepID=UPI002DD958C6|nr:hypothetical protein [Micromonospora sp. NBC_01796]WSA88623.1 hypothetical protein OIE47_14020 [Micromonospora sp. NBC_01796]
MTIEAGAPSLPGGLTTRRAIGLAVRLGATLRELLWLLVLAILLAALDTFLIPGPPLLLAVLGSVLAQHLVQGIRSGVPVTAPDQPALYALVAETAARLGVQPPGRITLIGQPLVRARATGRRRTLEIGLPLVACLSTAQLRALVGHQLTLLSHPRAWLVTRLWHRWRDTVESQAGEAGRYRRALAPFAAEVGQDADRAARTAAGDLETAAYGIVLGDVVWSAYASFLIDSATPPRRWFWFSNPAFEDLDDGWRQVVRHGIDRPTWNPGAAAVLATLHPGLARSLTVLAAAEPMALHAPADPVTVLPLDRRAYRRLVRRSHHELNALAWVRWTTFTGAPADWWIRRSRRSAEEAVEAVGGTLGPAGVENVDEIRLTDPEAPRAVPHLIEYALLRRGWQLEHPAVRGVLVSPSGQQLDATRLMSTVLAQAPDQATLRSLLTTT